MLDQLQLTPEEQLVVETPISADLSDEACSSDNSIEDSEEGKLEPRGQLLIDTFGDISTNAAGRFYWTYTDFDVSEERPELAGQEESKVLAKSLGE